MLGVPRLSRRSLFLGIAASLSPARLTCFLKRPDAEETGYAGGFRLYAVAWPPDRPAAAWMPIVALREVRDCFPPFQPRFQVDTWSRQGSWLWSSPTDKVKNLSVGCHLPSLRSRGGCWMGLKQDRGCYLRDRITLKAPRGCSNEGFSFFFFTISSSNKCVRGYIYERWQFGTLRKCQSL